MSPSARLWKCVLGPAAAVAVVAFLAAPVRAADPREKEASRLFFGGKYQEALAIYVDLVVDTSNPVYVCEIGRCYHRLGNLIEARRNVKECLSTAKLAAPKKRQYQGLLVEIDAAIAKNPDQAGGPASSTTAAAAAAAAAAAPVAVPPPAGSMPSAGPPTGAGAPPAGQQPYPGQPPGGAPYGQAPAGGPSGGPPPGQAPQGWQSGPYGQYGPPPASLQAGGQSGAGGRGWMKPTAYVAGAVGLLGVGAGAFSGLQARKKFDQVEKVYNDKVYENGKRLNMYQLIGYGVGAAGLGTAITLFILSPGSDETRVAATGGITLVAQPNGFGLAGRF